MNPSSFDVAIVGGGIMGCTTAYYLKTMDKNIEVAVIEKDPAYTRASTTLSLSNARIQFSLEDNVRISRYTFEVLERFEEEMAVGDNRPGIGLRRHGNLFLVGQTGRSIAESAFKMQKNLGCRVQWWSAKDIKARYPLYEPAGYAAGTFTPGDGHFDAYAVLMGYRAKAKSMGVSYLHDQVVGIDASGGAVEGVRLASGDSLAAGRVVNCAGAWAAEVASAAGIDLPVLPVKRQVFAVDTAVKPQTPLPLTVLPSGLFFRTDTGGELLVGKSMSEDPVGFDFNWDARRFNEILWPELAEFVPAFDTLKLTRGWAGLYAVNTLDGNAILGQWPELKGFYLANGFSGHGLQQAPAVGRYLAELITQRELSLDLSAFGPERILENRPLNEAGLV